MQCRCSMPLNTLLTKFFFVTLIPWRSSLKESKDALTWNETATTYPVIKQKRFVLVAFVTCNYISKYCYHSFKQRMISVILTVGLIHSSIYLFNALIEALLDCINLSSILLKIYHKYRFIFFQAESSFLFLVCSSQFFFLDRKDA